jgi:hypothetical protein
MVGQLENCLMPSRRLGSVRTSMPLNLTPRLRQHLNHGRRETALREHRRALHEKNHRIVVDFLPDAV